MSASAPQPVVSIIILCCNQVEVTKLCLQSLRTHTSWPHQLLLVDNGSTDATPEELNRFALEGYTGVQELALIRNEQNLGFAAGVNQALQRFSGEYVVLLNNDTVLTPQWLEGLLGVAQHVPGAGMIGAVSNEVPDPQRVKPEYGADLQGLDAFALKRQQQFARQVMEVERLSGFCLLIPRHVLNTVGLLDERFGLGFFEDDDLGVRVRRAGYKLLVGLDTYIHHWGSQTVRGLGLDATGLLQNNHGKFREKWGNEIASRYRVPGAPNDDQIISTVPAKISLTMIVKNEQANLGDCLACIHDLVDEMVIVDTGSTDQTKAMAVMYGATVIDFPWVDSFTAGRNVALEHASGDYIFWLDADDRINQDNRQKLKQLFASLTPGQMLGFDMKCVCLPDPVSKVTTVVDHIRLFPRHPAIRWKYRIHEQILPALRQQGGSVQFTDIQIHHVGYQDPALRRRKLERDIRLLNLENEEHPDDPFTLFNLGSVYLELQRASEAIPLLQRSLARSHPSDSIVRKLYALIVQGQKRLNQPQAALDTCQQGLAVCPEDAELLFQMALIQRDLGNWAQAATTLEHLLTVRPGEHFASVDVGLSSFKARHNLAVTYRDLGRVADSIAAWHQVLQEQPDFQAARIGLAETLLASGQMPAFEEQLAIMEAHPELALDVHLLKAKVHLAKKEFDHARSLLQQAIESSPEALAPRVILSHVYLQEAADWPAAEMALRDVLRRAPEHHEARQNLVVLLRQQGRTEEAEQWLNQKMP